MWIISVKFLTILTGKISIDTILYKSFAKIHFSVEFPVMSNIFLFISYYGFVVKMTNDSRHTYSP
jgi:hypothetical protein